MAYTPENNPYIPGDPYSYDLKWVVNEIDKWKTTENAVEAAAASAEAAGQSAEDAAASAEAAADSEAAAKDYADNIADPVSGLVTDWLAEHITQPTTPAIDTSLTVAGAAADAKATGKSMLFKKLDVRYTLHDSMDFNDMPIGSAYFMLSPTGNNAPATQSGIALTMQTNTGAKDAGIEQWYITQTSTPHWYWRRCYGSAENWGPWQDRLSHNLFSYFNPNYSAYQTRDFNSFAPGTVYFLLSPSGDNRPSDQSGIAFTMRTVDGVYSAGIEQWYITQTSTPHWYWRRCYGSAGNWEPWQDRLGNKTINYAEARFYAFRGLNIGFIGDSYTYNGSPSYPNTIAERDGITPKVYAFGGATTRSWLNTYNSVESCRAYILALGTNDMALTDYLGTPEDIGTAADTFYGNYSRIVEMCTAANPSARIYITDPLKGYANTTTRNYVAAIKNIAQHYGLYYAPFGETGAWYNLPTPDQGHPEALLGYATLAGYVSKAIGAAYIPT